MKKPKLYFFALTLITACRSNGDKKVGTVTDSTIIKDSIAISAAVKPEPATDSGRLVWHLDSLPKIKLPYKMEIQGFDKPNISLAEFKDTKQLFCIPYQYDIDSDNDALSITSDTTFDLVDTLSYKTHWDLIARTPKFVVIRNYNYDMLFTLNYKLKVIDAIRAAQREGNSHWNVERTTTIYPDLTLTLHYQYLEEVDERRHFFNIDDDNYQYWYITPDGYFKKQPGKHHKKH